MQIINWGQAPIIGLRIRGVGVGREESSWQDSSWLIARQRRAIWLMAT